MNFEEIIIIVIFTNHLLLSEMSSNIRYVAPFGELYTLYKDRFVRIAMSYVRDRMAAEDIVTDSYMAFWENRHELETANVPAWLYTVVVRKCRNWLREKVSHERIHNNLQKTELRILTEYVLRREADDPKHLMMDEALRIVERELGRMSPIRRRIFIAHRYDNMSYREIAAICSLTECQVDYELRAAKKTLSIALKDYLPLAAILIHNL